MIASLFSYATLYYTKVLLLILREQETNPVVILFDKRLFLWYNENKEIFQTIYIYFLEFFQIKFFYFFQEIFQKNQEKSSRKIWN